MMSIPDEFLSQLGRIVVASSELEARLHHILTLLASELPPEHLTQRRLNMVVEVLLADDSLNQRIERLEMLAARTVSIDGERTEHAVNRVVDDDLVESLKDLLERCRRAQALRNNYVHATWSTDPDGTIRRQTTRRLRLERTPVTLSDLMHAARQVEDAVLAAGYFRRHVHDDTAPPAL